MIDELMESPAFWMLGGGAIIAELLGWLYSRNHLDYSMPIWQLIIMMLGTLGAAAYFALKE